MSLMDWQGNGWLRRHKTSPQQIAALWEIVDRDLRDCRASDLSTDWQFTIAYNALLKLCTILLYSEGYRAEKNLAHYRTLQALPLILGQAHEEDCDYLDRCRAKRNVAEYDYAGSTTEAEVKDLIEYVEGLKREALDWLRIQYPELTRPENDGSLTD